MEFVISGRNSLHYHVKEGKLIAPEGEVAAWLALKAMGSKLDNSHRTLFPSGSEFEQA